MPLNPDTIRSLRVGGLWINGRRQDGEEAARRIHRYDAVVDNVDIGDFTTIADAFAAGNKTVMVRRGTYTEVDDIVIPEDGALIGEAPGVVQVVFAGGNSIKVDGSGRQTKVGTITVTNGSAAVVGVGTSFTSLLPGDWIRVGANWYQILSITDDTNLTLTVTYRGVTLSGDTFKAQSMVAGATIENIVGIGVGGSSGLIMQQVIRAVVARSFMFKCGVAATSPGVLIKDCAQSLITEFFCQSSFQNGIEVLDSDVIAIVGSGGFANDGHGLSVTGSRDTVSEVCAFMQNSGDGVNIGADSDRVSVFDAELIENNGNGVFSSNSSLAALFSSCMIDGNGVSGVDFDGSNNAVSDCVIRRNGGRGISAGDNGTITNCHVFENGAIGIDGTNDSNLSVSNNNVHDNVSDGIVAGQSNANVNGNRVRDNGGDGIELRAGADDSVANGNVVTGNGGVGLEIRNGCSNAVVDGNRSSGNTGGNLIDGGTGTTLGDNNTV